MTTMDNKQPTQAAQPDDAPERRPGHSRLVYDRTTRTINVEATPDNITQRLWEKVNEWRCRLIEWKHAGDASERDLAELAELQTLADDYLRAVAPLPNLTAPDELAQADDENVRLLAHVELAVKRVRIRELEAQLAEAKRLKFVADCERDYH